MDDISNISVKKDTTFAMLLSAQKRNYQIWTLDTQDIFFKENKVLGFAKETSVFDNEKYFFSKKEAQEINLFNMDIVLMRKDPPFNMDYIYTTYLLEKVQQNGVLVANNPKALRDFNEKLSILNFPNCITNTIVSANTKEIQNFIDLYQKTILKPLDGMGGEDIFLIENNNKITNKTIDYLTKNGTQLIMAQKFIPEIAQGDKRIIIINGTPIPYALARVPQKGSFKGNIAAGGKGVGVKLNKQDYYLCEQIAPMLKENGLLFVGLDVIGDFITEINITSPTCIRQLDEIYNLNIADDFFDVLEQNLTL
ncbi:Glutathione synthetase [hydrothermal vent metagenome]|uniref:Glutathione synthetase n=1 Tax=hydrothermal vent metagenome TaxID=652676 RepID=A0A1W1CU88_9ZZZZ